MEYIEKAKLLSTIFHFVNDDDDIRTCYENNKEKYKIEAKPIIEKLLPEYKNNIRLLYEDLLQYFYNMYGSYSDKQPGFDEYNENLQDLLDCKGFPHIQYITNPTGDPEFDDPEIYQWEGNTLLGCRD